MSKSTFPSDIDATIVKTTDEDKRNSEAQTIDSVLMVRHQTEPKRAHRAGWHRCWKKRSVQAILAWADLPGVMVLVSLPQTRARPGPIGVRCGKVGNAGVAPGTSLAHTRRRCERRHPTGVGDRP